ncbi:MAG: glycosyltransferase family 39 protein [Cyanobacteria bacterium P01_F01_bin.13]
MTKPVRLDRFVYLLMVVVLVVVLLNVHLWVITTGTEGAIADISREMLARGNFMHPSLLGVDDFSYFPGPLWFTSLGMKLWGINPFGARFFVQICLVVQVVFTYRISMRLFGMPHMGLLAGLVYLSCPLVLACSRYLSADIFAATFVLGAIYCTLFYHLDKRPVGLYGLAVMLALSALCGGVSSLLLPLTLGTYVLLFGPANYWVHWRHAIAATVLGIALTSFWFIHANTHISDFWIYTRKIFWRDPFFGPPLHPRWQYGLGFVLGSLPWWVVVVPNLTGPIWQNPTVGQVSILWLGLPLLFYSLTGSISLAGLLPVLAGFSILVAYLVHTLSQQQLWQYSRWFAQSYGTLAALALVIPMGYQILGQASAVTWPMAIPAIGVLGIVTWLYRFTRVSPRVRLVTLVLVPSLILLLYGGYYVQANGPWKESTDIVSRVIQQRRLEKLPVLVYNETLPSLAFGLNRDTITINDGLVSKTDGLAAHNLAISDSKSRWIHLGNPSANRLLRRLMTEPSVLVMPGKLPARWNWVKINYPKMEWAGRWLVLYRPQ